MSAGVFTGPVLGERYNGCDERRDMRKEDMWRSQRDVHSKSVHRDRKNNHGVGTQ